MCIYIYIYIVCIYIYICMYVYIVCFELSGICPNLGGQVAEVTTGAVDTCLGEDDDHSTSGVAARRSLMFGQAEHSLNMTDIPWSLKRNLTTL